MSGNILSTAIYIRVSTDMQVEDGYSISAQKDTLTSYCKVKGWDNITYYIDEGISGKSLQRQEVQRLIDDVKAEKINNVLVYKIDRITRSTKDLINLIDLFQKHNCEFNSLTENIDTSTPSGRGMLKLLGVFAEMERENISQRCSMGHREKARQGKITNRNNPPVGYKWNTELQTYDIVESECEIVRLIFDLYIKENSYAKVVQYLNKNKIPSRKGSVWYRNIIKGIINNPTYKGSIVYKRGNSKESFETQGTHPSIIDEETFNKAKKIADSNSNNNIRKHPSENATFSNHMYCSKCGGRMFASTCSTVAKGIRYYGVSYVCSFARMGVCDVLSISNQAAKKEFVKYFENIILQGNVKSVDNSKRISSVNNEINNIKQKIERVKTLYINGMIEIDEYKDVTENFNNQIERLSSELFELENETTNITKQQEIESSSRFLANNFSKLDKKTQQEFINSFIDKIYIQKIDGTIVISDITFL